MATNIKTTTLGKVETVESGFGEIRTVGAVEGREPRVWKIPEVITSRRMQNLKF